MNRDARPVAGKHYFIHQTEKGGYIGEALCLPYEMNLVDQYGLNIWPFEIIDRHTGNIAEVCFNTLAIIHPMSVDLEDVLRLENKVKALEEAMDEVCAKLRKITVND